MTGEPLAYDDWGDGVPILFVHGLTFNRRMWDPIVDRLRDEFRCLVVDLPGHGASTGSGADPVAVVERIRATVAATGIDRPVVVGHSAGAMTATGYVATQPARGLVNVDQTSSVGPFAGFVKQLEPALRGADFDSAFAPFRQSMGIDLLPEPERSRVAGTQRIDQRVVLDYWDVPLRASGEELQASVTSLLDAITVPYLWIAGHELPEADRELVRAHVPAAEIEEWPGSGHMVHLANPDRFAERLARFARAA